MPSYDSAVNYDNIVDNYYIRMPLEYKLMYCGIVYSQQQQDGAAQCYSEIEKLREAVEAYKEKNMFLANEVLEMNRLRSDDAELIADKSR